MKVPKVLLQLISQFIYDRLFQEGCEENYCNTMFEINDLFSKLAPSLNQEQSKKLLEEYSHRC